MPCRVAFERGKERLVHLLVVLQGTTGSLLLVEDIPFKQKRGMIRVTAPLAGSDVQIPSHTYIASGLFFAPHYLHQTFLKISHLFVCMRGIRKAHL